MVDVIPVLLLVFGVTAVLKPELVAAIDRRQKASGTTRRPEDIEMTDGYYSFIRVIGSLFVLFGVVFTLRSL